MEDDEIYGLLDVLHEGVHARKVLSYVISLLNWAQGESFEDALARYIIEHSKEKVQ